ncbi:MAG: response regulator [Hyphomicrobiaceae bacterium]
MSMSKARILFVDDDPFFSDLGKETLNERGFSVVTAADGNEALALIEREVFDLAIVDNEMPGLNGFEVIERMRHLENGVDVPVIMATGCDNEDSINKAFEVGAESFLAKPFDWSLLVHQANFVLKASRATKELRAALKSQKTLQEIQSRFVQTLVAEAQKPLKTVANFVRILKLEPDGPLGSDYYQSCVKEISQAVDRVESTIVKLVHRSDLGAQAPELDEGTCSVQEFVSENIDWDHREAHWRNIDVSCSDIVDVDAQLRCDRILLGQAIRNVLQSAIASSPRSTAINISVKCDREDGFRLIVDDKDTVAAAKFNKQPGSDNVAAVPLALQSSKVVIDAHNGVLTFKNVEQGKQTEIVLPSNRVSIHNDEVEWVNAGAEGMSLLATG